MKKAVAWPYLHFFCEAEGLEPSCLPVPLPPRTAVRCLAYQSHWRCRASVHFNGAFFVRWERLKLLAYLSPLRSSVPSRQTK